MKNKITDLNMHLFAQLERLGDPDLTPEEMKAEIERGKTMAQIATQIVNSAKVSVDAMKLIGRGDVKNTKFVNKLIGSNDQES